MYFFYTPLWRSPNASFVSGLRHFPPEIQLYLGRKACSMHGRLNLTQTVVAPGTREAARYHSDQERGSPAAEIVCG